MERKGHLGLPINLFMGHSTRTLEANSQNKFLDRKRNPDLRKAKAIKEFEKKDRRWNRDSFEVGESVLFRDPFNET